jgi:hypothetical protein
VRDSAIFLMLVLLLGYRSQSLAAANPSEFIYEAEFGGISAILVVVDVSPRGVDQLKLSIESIQARSTKALAALGLKMLTNDEAMQSLSRVAVVHVAVNVSIDTALKQVALKVDVELRRRVLVDCCAYVPLAIVWRSGDLGLYPIADVVKNLDRMVDERLKLFKENLEQASKVPRPSCDNCPAMEKNR